MMTNTNTAAARTIPTFAINAAVDLALLAIGIEAPAEDVKFEASENLYRAGYTLVEIMASVDALMLSIAGF